MSETSTPSSEDRPVKPDRLAAARAANALRPSVPKRKFSAITNGSKLLAGIDGRSPWVRRCRDLLSEHVADLGGEISVGERSLVRRCATITTELEFLEARFAAAETGAKPADLDLYLRAANNLRRLLQAVGLHRRARDITPNPLSYEHDDDVIDDAP